MRISTDRHEQGSVHSIQRFARYTIEQIESLACFMNYFLIGLFLRKIPISRLLYLLRESNLISVIQENLCSNELNVEKSEFSCLN